MRARYGPWALVAGASDGIGASFSAALASRGLDVILVARRGDLLAEQAARIAAEHGVATRTVVADLATPSGLAAVAGLTEEIGMLVCNAALAPVSPFLDLAPETLQRQIDLNCRAAAMLAHTFGAPMARRGRGGVILLSSMAGYQGAGLVAHYAATKAYLRVLAEGLWHEWRPHGVDVLACCPGLVATPTFARDDPRPGVLVPPPMSPDAVVRQGLAALGKRPVMVPGLLNRLAAQAATRVLPRRSVIRMTSDQTAGMYRHRLVR